jgi:hypothetical protein
MTIEAKRRLVAKLRLAFDWLTGLLDARLHAWEVRLRPVPVAVVAPPPARIAFEQWEPARRDVAPSRKTTSRRRRTRMTAAEFDRSFAR